MDVDNDVCTWLSGLVELETGVEDEELYVEELAAEVSTGFAGAVDCKTAEANDGEP